MKNRFAQAINAAKALLLLTLVAALAAACNSGYTPKPRGYAKIEMPAKAYQKFDEPGYPYSFEYPRYAHVVKDTSFFDEKPEDWWINLDIPSLNGRIYFSYKDLQKHKLSKMVNDAFNLTSKHTYKASSIDDSVIHTPGGVHGIFFTVGGNAASAYQFFLTDSSRSFFRGALYFNASPNEDSLKPLNDFLKQDLLHLINTFAWKK